MAASATVNKQRDIGGGIKIIIGTLAFDNSYAAGGEAVDLSSYFPGASVHYVGVSPEGGVVIRHDEGTPTAGKFLAYRCNSAGAAMTAVTTGADLSALSAVPFIAFGE